MSQSGLVFLVVALCITTFAVGRPQVDLIAGMENNNTEIYVDGADTLLVQLEGTF
jgi:hypothetical protein